MIKHKVKSRAGGRRPNKVLSLEGKLIAAIYASHGGLVIVAKKLGVSKQRAANWRDKGRVPLIMVKTVASILGVHPAALNFKQFFGVRTTWNEVVASLSMPEFTKKTLLKD